MHESSHQLAAIMFTDIVGYTSLMGKDEQRAIRLLDKNLSIQKPLIEQYQGKLLKEIGDGLLCSFNSAIEAVKCAIEIQDKLKDDSELNIRVGIHIGDVLFRDGDVFGDGVNIASRIESLASSGEILVSEAVYNSVKNQAGIQTEFVKEVALKNVEKPVEIYKVSAEILEQERISDSATSSSQLESTSTKPFNKRMVGAVSIGTLIVLVLAYFLYYQSEEVIDKSIAVLPFKNMSDNNDQQYFADGVMEDILNSLQRMQELGVISRTSVEQYRNTTKSSNEIGSELKVTYLLEGSVRKSDDQIMITAQLINANDDRHLWGDNFTSEYTTKGLFEIQKEIAEKIVRELELKISPEEVSEITKVKTVSKEAYDNYLKGHEILRRGSGTKQDLDLAVLTFQQAIEMDSNFSMAYIGLANTYLTYAIWGRSASKDLVSKAMKTALKAQRIGDEIIESYQTLGTIYIYLNELKTAEEYLNKVVEMSPNYAESYYWLGMLNIYRRNKKQALKFFNIASQLDPHSLRFQLNIAVVFYNFREYDKALEEINKVLKFNPEDNFALFLLANIYTAMGEYQKAIDTFHKRTAGTNTNWSLGYAYGLAGNKEEATRILNYHLEKKEREYVPSFMIGVIYIGLGNKEEAINWLERGYAESNNPILLIRFRPMLDPIKDESRLIDLLDRMEIAK